MENEKFYFEENRNKYSINMLDKNIDNNPQYMTLRAWIMQFVHDGYFDIELPSRLDDMTDLELCHVVDWIEYLESK